jgi:hypothetical protein
MTQTIETVATVLERELRPTIARWMKRVDGVPDLAKIPLSEEQRMGHLPQLIEDLIIRLRLKKSEEMPDTTSAHDHGKARFDQTYSVPMLVEESRLLQVSLFETLHLHQNVLDSNKLLEDVMIIADECDAQLKHTVETFMALESSGKLAAA